MAFYSDLAKTAAGLLATYNQGVIEIGRAVNTPGPNAWSPPVVTVDWTRIDAIAMGVSQGLVDGVAVVASDLQVTANVGEYVPAAGDLMRIDGKAVAVIRMDKIPAAGTTVAWRFIVRS